MKTPPIVSAQKWEAARQQLLVKEKELTRARDALAAERRRMPWYTIKDDFDKDFGVDEWHGTNAFIRDGDSVFRTYFINERGDEQMGNTWNYLDITALGRQEEWEDSPEGYPQTPPYEWWIWHDEPNTTDEDRPGLVQLRAARAASKGGDIT